MGCVVYFTLVVITLPGFSPDTQFTFWVPLQFLIIILIVIVIFFKKKKLTLLHAGQVRKHPVTPRRWQNVLMCCRCYSFHTLSSTLTVTALAFAIQGLHAKWEVIVFLISWCLNFLHVCSAEVLYLFTTCSCSFSFEHKGVACILCLLL